MRRSLMDDITKIAKGHFDFDDDLEDILDGKKKKKKKKDGGKKRKDKGGSGDAKMMAYKESLKALSKKELHAKMNALGISVPSWEMDDKKAMRKAILKAVKKKEVNVDSSASTIDGDDFPGSRKITLIASSEDAPAPKKGEKIKDKPICYFDEDNRDFVITNAVDRSDVDIFNSMRTLGKLRQHVRTDDGFGELMDRISAKLLSSDSGKISGEVIDVDYTVVDDDADKAVAALPEKTDDASDINKTVTDIVAGRKKKRDR